MQTNAGIHTALLKPSRPASAGQCTCHEETEVPDFELQANLVTHTVLLKPIKANVAEAHGQIASLLEVHLMECVLRCFDATHNLHLFQTASGRHNVGFCDVKGEYMEDERAAIGLTPPDELDRILSSLS